MFLIFKNTNAQDVVFSFSKKEFLNTVIELDNGKKLTGFVKDFTLPNTVEFRGIEYGFSSIESKLNLDRTKFKFKKSLESKMEFIGTDSIKSIVLTDKDTLKYEKIKLKTLNSKLEIIDLEREVMAPLIKKGKINLYAYRVYKVLGKKNLMYIVAYVRKPNDKYALIPLDINRLNIFNIGNIEEKFIRAYEEVGKDCPKFLEYLNYQKKMFDDKNFRKDYKEEMKLKEKEMKEIRKSAKSTEEENKLEDDFKTYTYLRLHYRFIDEYEKLCN